MITRNDLDLYEREADKWWNHSARAFRSLRSIKSFHQGELNRQWGAQIATSKIVDLGCGGGLLAIPLAQAGADVTGIDRSPASIRAAIEAATGRGVSERCRFLVGDLCTTKLPAQQYDFAVLSDVIEHVDTPAQAISEAARLLRPGGQLFINTLNRTWRARGLAVFVAENLGFVPRGTHDYRLFIKPHELREMAVAAGLRAESFLGEAPRILATLQSGALQMRRSKSTAVSYSAFFLKHAAAADAAASSRRES